MKRSLAFMFVTLALALAVCSLVRAQDAAGDRVVVPARNSTRPRKVDVSLMHGSITVKTYAGKEVIVETRNASSRRDGSPATVDGLRRLDFPTRGLTVEEEDNVVTVRMHANNSGEVVISRLFSCGDCLQGIPPTRKHARRRSLSSMTGQDGAH